MKKILRTARRTARTVREYWRAHRKAIIAGAALVGIQELDSETADWITAVLGVVGVLLAPNDRAAVAQIWRRRR